LNKILSVSTFLFTLCILCFSSCKSSKKVIDKDNDKLSVENLVTKINNNAFRPNWFRARAQMQYKMPSSSMSFSSTIISKNSEVLWFNGKKFGMEGARIMVTPDSVFALNRLQRQFLAEPLGWVASEYDLPNLLSEAIDLDHLQDIFIGNPIMDVIPYTNVTNNEGEILMSGGKENYESRLMLNASNLQPRYITFNQGESRLVVKYSDYRPLGEKRMIAYKRDITIKRPREEDILLSIQYTDIIIDRAEEINFNIPKNYQKM